jgi:hypothetical protein
MQVDHGVTLDAQLLIMRDRFRLTRQDEAMHNSHHGRTMQNTFRITTLLAYMLKQINGKIQTVLRPRITEATNQYPRQNGGESDMS